MTTKRILADWLAIDLYLEAFERAQRQGREIDLREFLPCREHPLYALILQELIRVDLEYQSTSRRLTTLDDYRQLFPEFFLDPQGVQEVAFEEYRQRRERGEDPAPAEYEQRYGVDTSGWPCTISLPRFPSRLPRL